MVYDIYTPISPLLYEERNNLKEKLAKTNFFKVPLKYVRVLINLKEVKGEIKRESKRLGKLIERMGKNI